MIPLSQRDSRWKDIKLGTSSTTIGGYGCVIAGLAIMVDTTPDIVNQKLLEVGGYSQGNLVVWAKVNQALPSLNFIKRAYSYSNDIVKKAIDDYGACLVEVDGKKIGGVKHWVLYIGNQQIIDPWWGDIRSTSEYPPLGYAVFEIKKEVNYEQELKDKISDLETKVATLNQAVATKSLEVNNLRTELETQERDNADLGKQIKEARSQREQFRVEAEMWQKKAFDLENQLNSALTENNALKGSINDLNKAIKDSQALALSKVDTGLVIKELFYRFFKR